MNTQSTQSEMGEFKIWTFVGHSCYWCIEPILCGKCSEWTQKQQKNNKTKTVFLVSYYRICCIYIHKNKQTSVDICTVWSGEICLTISQWELAFQCRHMAHKYPKLNLSCGWFLWKKILKIRKKDGIRLSPAQGNYRPSMSKPLWIQKDCRHPMDINQSLEFRSWSGEIFFSELKWHVARRSSFLAILSFLFGWKLFNCSFVNLQAYYDLFLDVGPLHGQIVLAMIEDNSLGLKPSHKMWTHSFVYFQFAFLWTSSEACTGWPPCKSEWLCRRWQSSPGCQLHDSFFKVSFMDLLTFQHSKHISPFLLLFHPYLHMKQILEREEKLDAQKYL